MVTPLSFELHENAVTAFNQRADDLQKLIQEFGLEPDTLNDLSMSDVHVSGEFSDSDIIGEIQESITDYRGQVVTRFFRAGGKKYGFTTGGYQTLRALAMSLHRIPNVGASLSQNYIEEKLFEWSRKGFETQKAEGDFCAFLQAAAQTDIREYYLWVPIANLQVEAPFRFGLAEIRPIRKVMIDDWERFHANQNPTKAARISEYFLPIRRRFQGFAAVCTRSVAEQERAIELALEMAERTTLYLSMFSVGALAPDIRCVSVAKGSEHTRQASIFNVGSDGAFSMSSRVLDHAESHPWRIDARSLTEARAVGFDEVSTLLRLQRPNDFQRAVLNALGLYCKATFTSDPVEKVVYVLASLESLLLKNQTEPIQQNLAERMAFFVGQNGQDRKNIIERVRFVYGIRSNYLHHGETEGEFDRIKDFLLTAWVFYSQVLVNWNRFVERIAFVNKIDDAKLGL